MIDPIKLLYIQVNLESFIESAIMNNNSLELENIDGEGNTLIIISKKTFEKLVEKGVTQQDKKCELNIASNTIIEL